MAISANAVCTSFKQELLIGEHNFTASTGDTFKIALYTDVSTIAATTTAYSTTAEVVGTGYTAGGTALTNVTPTTSGTTAYTSFSNVTWSTSTLTANGALIYNSTSTGSTNKSVVVLAFGSNKTSTAGDFTIVFPTADLTSAIIRIA